MLELEGKGVVLFEVNVNLDTRSASSKTELLVFGKTGTRFTGRFDYFSVITNAKTDNAIILRTCSIFPAKLRINQYYAGLKKATNLVEIFRTLNSGGPDSVQFLVSIIETKRLLATLTELEAHRPQVIAQSLAVYAPP